MNKRDSFSKCRRLFAGLATIVLAASPALAESNNEKTAEKAIWQVQDIFLSYFAMTTYYSCDGLRDRVRAMFAEMGMQETAVVKGVGCSELTGPSRHANVRIVMAYPVAATEANQKAAAQDAKRAELLAIVQKNSKSKKEFGAEPFDAERVQTTLLSKTQSPTSAAGDCELLEQLRDRVIKPMGGIVVKDDLRCIPYQGTTRNSSLTVEVLAEKRS